MTYTVTIYVAAAGTPLQSNGVIHGDSLTGHMYYETKMDGEHSRSFGFAPIKDGTPWGDGEVKTNDVDHYLSPRYARTLEITKEQYDKLNDYGAHSKNYGFSQYYRGEANSCVDFAWNGLDEAGLYKRVSILGVKGTVPNYEGSLKPIDNIDDIQSIKAPFPDSQNNREHWNSMPKQELKHKVFSENEPDFSQPKQASLNVITKNSSIDDMLDSLYVAAVNKDDKASCAVTHAYLQSDDGKAFIAQGKEFNQQIKANEQQAAFEAQQGLNQQAEMDAPARREPVMRVG